MTDSRCFKTSTYVLSYAVFVVALIGCSPAPVSVSNYQTALQSSPDFKDCVAVDVSNKTGGTMTVVRCPNSTTTTHKVVGDGVIQASVVAESK